MKHPEMLRKFRDRISDLRPPHGAFDGAGVVIAGGGNVYFSSAVVVARLLRALGCYLPVELWVAKGEAVPAAMVAQLSQEGIIVCDASEITTRLATNKVRV